MLNFFASYGALLAGFFAILAAFVGIISTFASNQIAAKSNSDLKRAVTIIERLEKQVSTVIGDEWAPLDTDQIEKLRIALASLPFTGSVQVHYLNAFGKPLAQSLAIAIRAAGWNVRYFGSGGGNEAGIEVGFGPEGKFLLNALAGVIDPKMLVLRDPQNLNPTRMFVIGVLSKPGR